MFSFEAHFFPEKFNVIQTFMTITKTYLKLVILTTQVSARFCEGGNHKCMPPKGTTVSLCLGRETNEFFFLECCAQGCCYLYSPPSAPRSPQPADHVLNLFFINHWYFWWVLITWNFVILRKIFLEGKGRKSWQNNNKQGLFT